MPSFVPAQKLLLVNAERTKGEPLTRDEAEAVRDGGTCIMVPASVDRSMAAERGYPDLDPEHVWDDWQQARPDLMDDPT